MHIKLRVLFLVMFFSVCGKAQTYYPLAADKTYGNFPTEAIATDSGIAYISCNYNFASGTRDIISSRFVKKTINSISKILHEEEISWNGSQFARVFPSLLKLNDGSYLAAAITPKSEQFISLTFNPPVPDSIVQSVSLLQFDSKLNFIRVLKLDSIGYLPITRVFLGLLDSNKIIVTIAQRDSQNIAHNYIYNLSIANVERQTNFTVTYFPSHWTKISNGKSVLTDIAAQHTVTDTLINVAYQTFPFILPTTYGYYMTPSINYLAGNPIYMAFIDLFASNTKDACIIYSVEEFGTLITSPLYVEPLAISEKANNFKANLGLSIFDSALFVGTNFTNSYVYFDNTTISNLPSTQHIRKVINGNLIWKKALGGDAAYYLNQVLATPTGIWVIVIRNKAGENLTEFDTYYALLDSNGNDIGPAFIPSPNMLEENKEQQITLTPNPATTSVTISTTFSGNYNLTITNQLGQMMYESKNASNKIDISKYAPGLYRFAVEHQNKKYVQMVVKQ
jgi:Secretion system C-terminal sorting domain